MTLPSRVLTGLTMDAPGGLGGDLDVGELSLWPVDTELDERVTLSLDIMDGDDLLISCPWTLRSELRGRVGLYAAGLTVAAGWN